MRKDYAPLNGADQAAGERYWTEQWDRRALADDASAHVLASDEYRIAGPFLDRLAPGARILDGGCGLGHWTLHLASRGFDAVGIDISAATIHRLRERYPTHAFAVGDVQQTALATASFDAYISWGTFEHFESGPAGCLREAHRILKPSGLLILTVPFQNRRLLNHDRGELWDWDPFYDRRNGYPGPMAFYQWRFTREELHRELALQGFETLRIAPIHKSTGAHRWLTLDRGLRRGSIPYRIARALATACLPAATIAHMLMAVARRHP